jgi:REP element-mobilizing transposase RayT
MARKPRIHYPGAFYHVILRGNAGDPIFFDDCGRYRLYLILQYAVEKFRCRIHAFCLMRNHIHLVVQVEDVPLSRIMQNVSLRFTKWINYSQSRTGHLFQGRFKAILIDADAYLLELVRYVHLNPVRAGAASAAGEFPWSGHRGYLGKEHIPWLTTDLVLSMLSPGTAQARRGYEAFVRDGMGEGRRGEFHSGTYEGRILGDETFTDDILDKANQRGRRTYSLDDVIGAVCAQFQVSAEKLKAPGKVRPMTEARAVAAAIVQATPHLRLTDLAQWLGRDVSALGKAAQRVGSDERVRRIVDALDVKCHRPQTNIRKSNLTP